MAASLARSLAAGGTSIVVRTFWALGLGRADAEVTSRLSGRWVTRVCMQVGQTIKLICDGWKSRGFGRPRISLALKTDILETET